MEPEKAVFVDEKQLILENIDLKDEILTFCSVLTNDKEEAEQFILHNHIEEYGETTPGPLIMRNFDEKQKSEDTLSVSLVSQWISRINNFKDLLKEKCNSFGLSEFDFEIHKPNEELQKILYEMKLYSHGQYNDEKLRQYANYYYKMLAQKSRDNVADLLMLKSDSNTEKSNSKKSGKNK